MSWRQFCRNNVTVLSGHFIIFIEATHLDTEAGLTIFQFVSGPWGYITLSLCRCRKAKKLLHAQLCNLQGACDKSGRFSESNDGFVCRLFLLKFSPVVEYCII